MTRNQSEDELRSTADTLREVMSKLEEAMRLARSQEQPDGRESEHCCAGTDA